MCCCFCSFSVHLDVAHPLVCNNAAWTIGGIALQTGGQFMQPFIGRIMNPLISALQTHDVPDTLKVNIAVTIGRLGLVNTQEVAEVAEEFFADWCSVLSFPCPVTEKSQAFTGLISIVKQVCSLTCFFNVLI